MMDSINCRNCQHSADSHFFGESECYDFKCDCPRLSQHTWALNEAQWMEFAAALESDTSTPKLNSLIHRDSPFNER